MSNPFAKYLEATQRQQAKSNALLEEWANTPSKPHQWMDITNQGQDNALLARQTSTQNLYIPQPQKSVGDYAGDTAVDATKAAMTLAQTGISALDLGAYSLGGLASAVQQVGHEIAPNAVPQPKVPEYGQITKVLDDGLGFNIGKAKQTLGELGYSDIRKTQEQELHTGYTQEQIDAFNNEWANQYNLQYQDLANKGANALQLEGFKAKFNDNYKKAYTDFMDKYQTSWDKSLGENLSIMGKAFGTVLDNPSLGVGAAIESTGYLPPSFLVSRGVAALQGAAKTGLAERAIAAGIGEGSVSALALNEQMRGNSDTGTIDGTKVAAGFGGGALTGLIGGVSNKLGSRFGADDIDSLSLGTQAKGFSVTRPVLATAQEGAEEFLQSFGESILPNIAEGKDPLQGLAQEVALGTVAGNIMGGATNARSLVSGAGSDLLAGFNKVAEAVGKGKDAVTAKTFEEFNDPTNKAYDPAKAFNSQVPDLSSADETVRAKAQENIDSVFNNLEQHTNNLINEKVTAEGILKNIAALPVEEQAQHAQAKTQAEKAIKSLEERIVLADNQMMDLFEQQLTLGKNKEVQAGIPQYSEEQAKADIELLSQESTSTAVWATEDNDGNTLNIPVTITGTPVVSNGYETVEVKYTDSTGKERTTYAPTSELVQDTTTQQEAAQRITKHFSKLSLDELATVAKSPYLSEEQRNSLRYLSEAKRAIADLASPTDVTDHIMNGLKGKTPMESHRGLNNYTDMVNAAINTKDEKLLNLALNDLGRFAQDHTDKANALVEANQLVTSGQFPKVQVLRSNDGTWGIVTDPNKFVDNIKLKATAGWNVTVHSNKKGAIDLVTKEATLIQDNLKALTQVGLSFGLQAVEPTVTPPVTVEALPENAKLQDANIKPTEDAEVLQEVDVVLPLVQQPVNLFEREDGTWSDDLLKARKEIRELHEEELKKWGEVNKPIPKGSFIDSLHTAFNPLSANTQIGLESTKSVDAALGLNVSLNALWALRLIFAKAYNSLQKTHAKRLKEKSGDYFSFRSKDDPKYKAHQEKLDALRQSVENAISTLKISLNALDKAILEKTKGTSEALQEANKPVATSSDTTDITSAITRLNKYNKSGTPLTIDSVTPEALQTLQAKVSSAFEIGAVNQQTYDGVTKDIATLQQYLSSAKPNKQNQEVSKTNTTTQPSTKHNTQDTSNITDNQKTDTPTLTPNFAGIGTRELNKVGEQAIKDVYAKTQQDNKSVTTPVSGSNTQATTPTVSQEVVTPATTSQTEPTATVNTEPTKDTTQAVKVNKKDGVSGLKSISASKKNQTSDDVPDLVEALKAEAQKRVNLTDEDTVGYKALSELISLAYGNEISIKNLETIDQLFGEDLVNEALRIKSLPLGKRAEAQGYLEDIRFDIGSLGTFKARIEDVTPEDLNTYKELVFKLLKERNLSTKNASKIFNKLATYVNSNQAVEAPVTQDTSPVVDTVNTVLQNQKVTQTSNNTKPISNQTSEDTETLIEALESEASKRITLSEEDTIESEALNELISLAYGADVTNADLKTIREIFGEDLVNEALRIRNLPLSKKDEAQKYLEQIRTILASAVEVKFYVEEVTLEDLATYKEAVLGLLQKRKQNTANASKIFDVLTAYVTQNQAATAQPETKVESDEATQANQSIENQVENKDKTQTEEAATAEGITQFKFKGNTHTLATRLIDQWHKAQDVFEDLLKVTSSNLTPSHVSVLTERLKALIPVQPETWIRFVNVVDSGEGVPESILTKGGNTRLDINGIPIILVNLHNPVPEMDLLETTTHEYVHAVTVKWLVENPNSIEAQRLQQVIDALGEYLKTTKGLDAETIKRATQAQKNIREVIAFGLTNEKVMNVIDALLIEDMQNDTFEQSNEGTREQAVGGGRGVLEASEAREESSDTGRRGHSEKSTGKSSKTGRQVLEEVLQVIVESTLSKENQVKTVTNQAEVGEGTITVLQGVTEEVRQEERSKLMSLRNMLVAYFTQSSIKEEGKGTNPLVAVKDYILQSNLLTQVSNWLSTGYKVSNAQRKQLEHFKEFHQEFRKHILFSLQNSKRNRSDNNSDNFITYLITEDVKSLKDTLDENTLTAISLAAYSYLLQYGTKVTNTDDEIRKLLRLEKDAPIPDVTSDLVRNAGQDAYSVAKELGSGISSSLGLKALKDSSTSMQDRLNTAFGLLAIAALHNSDYMYISRLPSGSIKAIKEDLGISTDSNDSFETQKGETLNLSQLTTISANYKLNPQTNKVAYKDGKAILVRGKDLEELLAVNKNTKGFLSQLFGVSVGFRLPSTSTPEKFTQKSIPNTNASIPSNQRKQVEAAQKNSNVMRVNTVNVFKTLFGLSEDSKYLKELLGIWVDDNVLAQTHVTKHESLRATAENEWRLVNQGLEWAGYIELGNDEYAEFYDIQNVVQNNRMHIESNLFNQQSSQIHRAMAAKSSFAVTFNIFENQELLTRFYQGVAEGLEKIEESIKQDIIARNPKYNFFTVDKVPAKDFVPAFEKFLSTPKSIAAIDAMITLIQTKSLSTQQQTDIAWFVSKGGMGVQSLQSLIFLAELGIATKTDGVLTTTVSYGSDGINNGVSNANMLLGTARESMRTQTGIISDNSSANNIQEVYAQGINDYYVDFGSYMRKFLVSTINKAFDKIREKHYGDAQRNKINKVNALLALFPTFQVEVKNALGMRKIAKVWSIPFNYAAGKVALQRALANGFMKGIYDEMERINNSIIGKPRNSLEYATAIQDRNTLEARLNAVLNDDTFVYGQSIKFEFIKLPLPENLNTFTFQDAVKQYVGNMDAEGNMTYKKYTLTGTDATYAIERTLKAAMTQLHGKAAWTATEVFSKDYMDMYSLYLKAQGTSFELYNFIHSKLVQLKLDAKIKKSKVEGEYMGLTTLELQEIDNIIGKFKPVVNTPISSTATNARESGIFLVDKDKKLEKGSQFRQVSSSYFIKGFEGTQTPTMKPSLVSHRLTDKGTAGLALVIQGMDSLVASAVQAKYPILNIHDQASMPINLANEIIQYQNEVHLEGLMTYHLGLENAKTLVNTFRGVLAFINSDSKVLDDEKANAELLVSLATDFKKLEPKLAEGELVQNEKTGEETYTYKGLSLKYPDMALGEPTTDLKDAIKTFVITAIRNDMKKLSALLKTKAIHQYGGEGGAIPVTKEHREKIQEQLKYLQRQRASLVDSLDAPVTKDFTVIEEYQSPLITALEAIKANPITKDAVLDLLTKTTHHKDTDVITQEQEVLSAIKNLIPDDLTLVYEDATYEGQGYYNTETKRIHIKAITSEGSYVDTHLLVHELLHSAVAARLQAIKDNPNKYDEARAAVTQLEAIRQEVLNLLSTDGLIFTELNEKLNADNVDLTALSAEVIARLQAINKEEQSLRDKQKELSAQWESSNDEQQAKIRKQQAKTKAAIDLLNKERGAKLQILKDIDAYIKARNNLSSIKLEGFGTALSLARKLKNLDEFIAYGLSNQNLQSYLKGVELQQNKLTVPDRKSRWRRFVEAVTKLVDFRGKNGSNALTAFAVTTAELFEQLKSVTPADTKKTLKSEYSASNQVNQMSSIQVMQSLPHTGNSDFGLHLNRLAETVIGQLYNNDEVAKAQIDVIQAIQVAPAIKAGFNLSQREAAVQRSLELVLETYTLNTTGGANASQLWKIYKEAQKNIKVENLYDGDWSTATAQERAATHQKFKYLFADNLKGTEALARFVSMALASEEVHDLLGFNTVTAKPSKQKSWFDTVSAWAQYVFAWLGNKLVRTSANDPAYKQLQSLVNNLVALDIRNRQDTVALYEKAWNLVGKVTEPLDKAAQSLRQYATNRDFLRNSKYLPLRTLGSIAALDAKAMGETIPKLIREMRDKARPNEKLGEAMNALMESTAMTQIRKAMEALIRQANLNAKERQDRTDNVKKAIMSWFKDGGKHITKEMHKAITYTLLRTDAQSLLTTFGLNKTIGLLLDTNKLKNEIDLVTKDISRYPNGVDMIHAAEDLGYYMVSNKGGMGLSKNPTAIAMGLGTNYQIPLENVDQALVGQLDVLVSLYAMKYTSAKDRKVLGDMYAENPEALEGLLQMHKGFMTDAATEFKDNPLNYVKGWMPEIVNPYREVRAVSSTAERDQMIKEGWKLIEEIKPHGKFLMIHPDIGYQRLVSGAVDLQNSHRKGTEIIDRQSKQYLAAVKANLAYTVHRASIPLGQYDPTKKPTGLIPAYDTDGVPMGFNYEMASWVRDKEMERNNNFADLMGAYAGAMFYKPAKRNQSVTVANVLFEDYKQNYQKNPNSYIKLSGKSSDPKIVEMWRMLPKDFRQRATELYGKGEPIIINNEAFLLAFGFKKWTITSIWDKPADQRTDMETMFITMAEKLLGDTAKARISKAGHIWTEAVSKAKDFIVIRSISVLWNNVLSNGLMLMANGINPINIAKEWTFITANTRSYQKLNSELIQLKANTLAGKGNDALERQINAIQKQLEANPMNKYINEGLLSSIVEDVTIQQGDYSYDSELKKKIDGVTGWLPDSVKTIGAWAVLNPSTQGYQFLATTTQLSDFVAKVTLAKHLESKGMDFKAAVSEASQTFINYDVPQGVGMQYMNDIGLFMFTKFFLRIQAVLLKLMDKKAATVLAQHIAVEGLTDMQSILDPMALTRIGNWPFEEGAFSIVGASMSIAPVNVVF